MIILIFLAISSSPHTHTDSVSHFNFSLYTHSHQVFSKPSYKIQTSREACRLREGGAGVWSEDRR